MLSLKSINKAAECGADCKIQMHISEEETLKNAPNPPYFKKEKDMIILRERHFLYNGKNN